MDPKPWSHGSSKRRMLSFFHVFLLFLLPSSEFLGETTRRHLQNKWTQPPPLNLHQEARTNAGIPLRLEACKEFSFIAMLACNTPNNILSMCISEVSCTWLMIGCECFWKKGRLMVTPGNLVIADSGYPRVGSLLKPRFQLRLQVSGLRGDTVDG